jgi:hypothetical protein
MEALESDSSMEFWSCLKSSKRQDGQQIKDVYGVFKQVPHKRQSEQVLETWAAFIIRYAWLLVLTQTIIPNHISFAKDLSQTDETLEQAGRLKTNQPISALH